MPFCTLSSQTLVVLIQLRNPLQAIMAQTEFASELLTESAPTTLRAAEVKQDATRGKASPECELPARDSDDSSTLQRRLLAICNARCCTAVHPRTARAIARLS